MEQDGDVMLEQMLTAFHSVYTRRFACSGGSSDFNHADAVREGMKSAIGWLEASGRLANQSAVWAGGPVTEEEVSAAMSMYYRGNTEELWDLPGDPLLLKMRAVLENFASGRAHGEPTEEEIREYIAKCLGFPCWKVNPGFMMGAKLALQLLRTPRPKQDANAPIKHLFWAAEDGSMNEADKSANDCIREAYQIGLRAADRKEGSRG